MAEGKPRLLIVEDDLDVAEMLAAYFHIQGYEVLSAQWGEDAVHTCRTQLPDLVLLDIRLPDIDGYEVARRLRSQRRTSAIPILFLTEKRQRQDRLQGLSLGADDYITKPFDIQELRLRVRNALRRVVHGPLTNPVTNLPAGPLVDERLRELLDEDDWAMLVIAIRNLDAFRNIYGFVAADDVLRAVGIMVHNIVRSLDAQQDFVGHLERQHFILICGLHNLETLNSRIQSRLEQALEYFYPLKDREHLPPVAERLGVGMVSLNVAEGPFQDLQDLKARIRQRLQG